MYLYIMHHQNILLTTRNIYNVIQLILIHKFKKKQNLTLQFNRNI